MKRKYRNTPVVVDGIRFDSKKEAKRWGELRSLEMASRDGISRLQRQVPFALDVNGQRICKYVADFMYYDHRWDPIRLRVEDVKSPATRKNPVYRIKKKLMKAIHGIDIMEV